MYTVERYGIIKRALPVWVEYVVVGVEGDGLGVQADRQAEVALLTRGVRLTNLR